MSVFGKPLSWKILSDVHDQNRSCKKALDAYFRTQLEENESEMRTLRATITTWNRIPQEQLFRSIESFPNRISELIANNGGSTSYRITSNLRPWSYSSGIRPWSYKRDGKAPF